MNAYLNQFSTYVITVILVTCVLDLKMGIITIPEQNIVIWKHIVTLSLYCQETL